MNEHQFRVLIAKGEGLDLEFKTCADQISKNVYETVCAFLNRNGGTILLGVQDDGTVQGIEQDAVSQVKKDFVTAINNPQKIYPPTYLSIDEVTLKRKLVLRVYVPESSQVHRCNGRIYDRNEDGDFDITDHTRQVAELYQRKQATYSENKIYPFAGLDELERDLISIRDAIFREVASNILIHREYMNAFPAKLVIERGQVRTENSNKPHSFGVLNPGTFTPFPKNPVIAGFFRQIGRADELGSGMRNMMKYGKPYGGADPQLIEGDVFRTVITVPELAQGTYGVETALRPDGAQSGAQSGAQLEVIVNALAVGPLSTGQLVHQLGLKSKTGALKRSFQELLDRGLAEYTIPDKPNSRLQKYRITKKGQQWVRAQSHPLRSKNSIT